ncbi:GTP diphosphokinase [Alkalilimnicola sp. S0819]|uniref:GTP diphosphokinase n=1 Tax=Alkalilimnicola sp. S0819 TaxID=2613922 RepID=UPI0012623A8D|nr:GTP diphosphokinase [Alkalilimnicola sp. S0819]KAB7627460.1 GTP diphosphokinase [Alkalilimnicola sp. S0819]MPQ15609.1 GTP diphosphokinase [Alkalilimnicola sp. S0819]
MVSINSQAHELINRGEVGFEQWAAHLPVPLQGEERTFLHMAWQTADASYGERLRENGEIAFRHALAVATIVAELRLDVETIAAALLKDISEAELEALRRRFGTALPALVEGTGRMRLIEQLPEHAEAGAEDRAEPLRKMLLAMARDVRVVFITLAERLQELRLAKGLPEDERRRLGQEVRDIYAPLANRLGIWQLKWELEDLAFRYLEPANYKRIAKQLAEKRRDREAYIAEIRQTLQAALAEAGVEAEVRGRPKHLYSIWKKMQRKQLDFNELYDIRALRVMVHDVPACYAALGVVHGLWRHIPKEFDDYIATPKENNYRSLHTAVIGPGGMAFEVQIRTRQMHQEAELGIAAHWRYKEGGSRDADFERKLAWLRQLLESGPEEGEDLLDRFKGEVFEDRVYAITPKGRILDLPRGATALDFAYYIHSDIGHHCRGAKINGRMTPLTQPLRNGDQVEILTHPASTPSRDWLNPSRGYLGTSRARAKARTWFRQQDHDKNISAGRAILDRELHRLGVQDVNLERLAQKNPRFPKVDDFLAAIGRQEITGGQIAQYLSEQLLPAPEPELHTRPPSRSGPGDDVSIYGVGNLLTRLARCCRPAPGDAIVGFITRGQGVTVHRGNCPTLQRLRESEAERLIDVSWSRPGERRYPVEIHVRAHDRQGLIRDISAILSNDRINVLGINTRTDAREHLAHMDLTVEIEDVAQLSRLMDRIGALRNVMDVRRRG